MNSIPKDLVIIGSLPVKDDPVLKWSVWYDEATQCPYEHADGQWKPIYPIPTDVLKVVEDYQQSMLVLAVTCSDHDGTLYLDKLKGLEEQLQLTFFGEGEGWQELCELGCEVTIRVERMRKDEYAKLEPFEP